MHGAKGIYRSARSLARDVTTAVASVAPAVDHDATATEQLNTKAVGIKGAKESLKARLQRLENEEQALPKTARPQSVPKSTPPTWAMADQPTEEGSEAKAREASCGGGDGGRGRDEIDARNHEQRGASRRMTFCRNPMRLTCGAI